MTLIYQKSLPSLSGPLAEEMTYAVAEDYFARNQRLSAFALFRALAKDEGKLAGTAKLRLAEIALRENKPQDCLAWCRRLLAEKPPVDRTTLLNLMGQAYEAVGEHRKAAVCFAGQEPE